jgi:CHASE2 domain-containing sensor protein
VAEAKNRPWIRRRGPWLLMATGLLTLVAVLSLTQPMPRADQLLQDSARAAMASPPSGDIVIVAIDEKSLAAIGRWPWRRTFHAGLLRRIAAQSPRCIGLNVLFAEPDVDHPGDAAWYAASSSGRGSRDACSHISRWPCATPPAAPTPERPILGLSSGPKPARPTKRRVPGCAPKSK